MESGVTVFYDRYHEATLWGKDLSEHLAEVYGRTARFCVMFISREYIEKMWTTHERRSAFEKAIKVRQEYILPARFDDTEVTGLSGTLGYVDCNEKNPRDLSRMVLQKLGRV